MIIIIIIIIIITFSKIPASLVNRLGCLPENVITGNSDDEKVTWLASFPLEVSGKGCRLGSQAFPALFCFLVCFVQHLPLQTVSKISLRSNKKADHREREGM